MTQIAFIRKTWTLSIKSSKPFTLADHTLYSIFVPTIENGDEFLPPVCFIFFYIGRGRVLYHINAFPVIN